MREYEVVDMWVGELGTEEEADDYFEEREELDEEEEEETYYDEDEELEEDGEDEDQRPISPFVGDMGEVFIDHDYMERNFLEPPTNDLRQALSGISYSSSFIDAAEEVFHKNPCEPFDTMVLVWNREIAGPRSVETDKVSLHYVGRFACDPKADPVS